MDVNLPCSVYRSFADEGIRLFYAQSVDSTNIRARRYTELPDADVELPVLFIAEEQTAGRGRQGKSFFSPRSTGLYMTLLIKVSECRESFSYLTAIAAVSAVDAIKELFGVEPLIKWVNDLYLDGRKVAGILTESFYTDGLGYVAIGIGINLSTDTFPKELAGRAGSIAEKLDAKELPTLKAALALLISKKLLCALDGRSCSEYMKRYRNASCVIGRRIRFLKNGVEQLGTATDITDSGTLIVELNDGETTELSSGEISIFSLDGEWR